MSTRNLLEDPCWSSKDLGEALPNTPHAVSVALPRWEDVIAYEEKDPYVLNELQAIYPRFGLNPLVSEVAKQACQSTRWKECTAWPYPNLVTAQKASRHCSLSAGNGKTIITEVLGLYCLIADRKASVFAKAFWQHTGLGASSRLAAIALNQEKAPSSINGENARAKVRTRLANIYSCNQTNIELHPSGMAAFNRALEMISKINLRGKTLQLGFPYVDVLKLPQVIFDGSKLVLSSTAKHLAAELDRNRPSAVVVELPSNPMLQCIDLKTVSELAHERGIPLIADDTIGSAVNIHALPFADLIFSSLTKSFAGRGDILAGSLVISPYSQWKKELKEVLASSALAPLADADAIALEQASKGARERIIQLNQACLTLKRKLDLHPAVARVLHPESCPNFQSVMKPGGGFGCLLSIELVGGLTKAKSFYNELEVCKGPSLGTSFTLACPYVLLAHYNELEWAQKCGVPKDLIRVSVGLEDPDSLWSRFQKALGE